MKISLHGLSNGITEHPEQLQTFITVLIENDEIRTFLLNPEQKEIHVCAKSPVLPKILCVNQVR